MGEQVRATVFTREDRQRYREKVRRCLDVLERMLAQDRFDFDQHMTGMEIELNLVDDHGDPTMRNIEVLALIDDPDFQTELGRFNLEINVRPRTLDGSALVDLESDVRSQLNAAQQEAHKAGAGLVM